MQPAQGQPPDSNPPTGASAIAPELVFRRELALAFGLFQLIITMLSAVSELLWGTPELGLLNLSALPVVAAILFWLRRGGDPSSVGTALMATIFLSVTATNVATGGEALGANIALPTIALFGMLLSSRRAGIFWVALVTLEIIAMAFVRRSDLEFPVHPNPRWVAYAIDRVPFYFSLASAVIGWLVLRALDRYRGRLQEARDAESLARAQASMNADRFADFAAVAADGFWETDAELRLSFVSPSFAQAMGVEAAQMLGLTPDQAYLVRFPDATGVSAFMQPMRDQQAFHSQLLPASDPSGKRRWLHSQGRPMFSENGVFQGYRGTVKDVTEQRRAEKALKNSEHRLRMITDHVPALISYIDRDRRFRFNNAEYATWLRRPLTEITDRRIDEVYSAETYANIEPHLTKAFAGNNESFEMEANARQVRVEYIPDVDRDGVVLGVYGLVHDITALKRVENELRALAQYDELTGLANRRRYTERVAEAIARSARGGRPMALVFMDLDRFKEINDSFGHKGGDLALQEFARRVQRCIRDSDMVARLSGDEFVIVLEALHAPEGAEVVARKIFAALAPAFDIDGVACPLSASIGIAVRRDDEFDAEGLLHRADGALYDAKAAGRGGFRIAPYG